MGRRERAAKALQLMGCDELNQLIDAWRNLSADLRRSILAIANLVD